MHVNTLKTIDCFENEAGAKPVTVSKVHAGVKPVAVSKVHALEAQGPKLDPQVLHLRKQT